MSTYDNIKAFQSQESWGRLELKPNKNHLSRFRHMSKPSQFWPSPASVHIIVNPLGTMPLEVRWTCPNHLNWCWTHYSSISATPILSYIIIPDPIHSCMTNVNIWRGRSTKYSYKHRFCQDVQLFMHLEWFDIR
jgi:hypothetical protein